MTTHVDLAKLEELRALQRPGQEGFLNKIATVFLNDAQVRVAEIERAVQGNEAEAVVMAAHALKGSCSYLGAQRLGDLCSALEVQAESGELEGGGRAVEEIKNELTTVSAILTDEMTNE